MGTQRSFGPMHRGLIALGVAAVALTATSPGFAAGNSLDAKSCQKNGWQGLVTSSGAPFANEGACTSYAARGGDLKKPQAISFTSANPSPVMAGGASYTPAATSTSGLAVAITLDPSSTGCLLSSGVVSFTGAGTCVLDADQAGDSTYVAAVAVQQQITVAGRPSPEDVCRASNGYYFVGTTGWSCAFLQGVPPDLIAVCESTNGHPEVYNYYYVYFYCRP